MPSMSHREGKGLGTNYSDVDKWSVARDYFEFVYLVDNFLLDIKLISFDHDLACYDDNTEYTGKTAADYLINKCIDNNSKLPDWFVHSDNTSGKKNIIGSLLSYMKNIEGKDISKFHYFHSGCINGNPL